MSNLAKEREIFESYLRQKGLKLTKQRQEILDTFLKTEKHLSTEELYRNVNERNPSIGLATVFRTLKLLAQADIAQEIVLGKTMKFEHKYGHRHHDHLICIECSGLIEAVNSKIEKLQNSLCRKFGFTPLKHKLQIFGICKSCQAKAKGGEIKKS